MEPLVKYPRTHHLETSRLQPGDEDLTATPFSHLHGRHLVVEEKMDGANAGLSFSDEGDLLLQCRGHYLAGGPRERHFNLLKAWAHRHASAFRQVLGSRYIVFGEWLYAKHTVFYDLLPHYFMEFDVFDRERAVYLDTASRARLLDGLPLFPVRVLHEGAHPSPETLPSLVAPSAFISKQHKEVLSVEAKKRGLDGARIAKETDPSGLMEGLYVKIEEGGQVQERLKWIRRGFLQAVFDAEGHWLSRPILQNKLTDEADLDAPCARGPWT